MANWEHKYDEANGPVEYQIAEDFRAGMVAAIEMKGQNWGEVSLAFEAGYSFGRQIMGGEAHEKINELLIKMGHKPLGIARLQACAEFEMWRQLKHGDAQASQGRG